MKANAEPLAAASASGWWGDIVRHPLFLCWLDIDTRIICQKAVKVGVGSSPLGVTITLLQRWMKIGYWINNMWSRRRCVGSTLLSQSFLLTLVVSRRSNANLSQMPETYLYYFLFHTDSHNPLPQHSSRNLAFVISFLPLYIWLTLHYS